MEKTYFVKRNVLADKGSRLANYLIDYIVVIGLSIVFLMALYLLNDVLGFDMANTLLWIENMNSAEEYVFGMFFTIPYYFFMESLTYTTIGKLVTGTTVVDKEGNPPDTKSILKRTFTRIIPFDALSFLGQQGRGWHDTISNTYVVKKKQLETDRDNFYALETLGEEISDDPS
ncbi:MAG: RDD family protein [Saprospiraceae bacterium]|nr:RDD family protein [Saprospiraceae bacterium]